MDLKDLKKPNQSSVTEEKEAEKITEISADIQVETPAEIPTETPAPVEQEKSFVGIIDRMSSEKKSTFTVHKATPAKISPSTISEKTEKKEGLKKVKKVGSGKTITDVEQKVKNRLAPESAGMAVLTIDLAVSRFCAVLAGNGNPQKFKMTKEEKEEYKLVLAEYLKTVQVDITPKQMLFFYSFFILGGNILTAGIERYERVQFNKNKPETPTPKKVAKKSKIVDDFEQRNQEFQEKKSVQDLSKRKKFQVTKDGNFKFDENGDYAKIEDQQKAPDFIIKMISEGKKNKEIISYLKNK